MIRNKKLLERLQQAQIAKERFSYPEALAVYEGLYREALELGIFTSENILEGIEQDIRIAKTFRNSKQAG